MENMKFNPDDFTSAEAKEFNARADDAMEEAFQLADQLRRDDHEPTMRPLITTVSFSIQNKVKF